MEQKKIYDAFFSYAHRDRAIAENIIASLESRGISVWYDDGLSLGVVWGDFVADAISSTRYFIPLISENFMNSANARRELQYACELAQDRSKTILPIVWGQIDYPLSLPSALNGFFFDRLDSVSGNEVERVTDSISEKINGIKNENVLYEKLSEYVKAEAHDHAARVLSDLCVLKCKELLLLSKADKRRDNLGELVLLLETMQEELEKTAQERFDFAQLIDMLEDTAKDVFALKSYDLYYLSLIWRICCYVQGLWRLSNREGPRAAELRARVERAYRELAEKEGIDQTNRGRYAENEWKFILQTPMFAESYTVAARRAATRIPEQSDEDSLLLAVADYMQKGNELFALIDQRDTAQDFLQCLILSYERLKAYCEVVGERKIATQCIERIFELKERAQGAKPISDAQKARTGIQTLLGLTVPKSGKFDLFISHKKEDMDIASDMYYFMKKNMKEVFFDKYSLPEMSEAQYRKAIMQALDGSKHFVVVFSDLAYLESDWVKLEMEVFQSEMDEGRKPGANFILVATDEVYDKIMQSNKTVLPIEYRRTEIMRVRDYKANLLKYISK